MDDDSAHDVSLGEWPVPLGQVDAVRETPVCVEDRLVSGRTNPRMRRSSERSPEVSACVAARCRAGSSVVWTRSPPW